ncbi:MAG: LptF/LptG family permease [Cytophagales bacterium]|nr:LptF/LptG family permease [Cytophagales bacterium]
MGIKKIDKLIIKSFINPFLLTTIVATFILLIQYMLKYFDDFVGKDLGFSVFGELIFYFSLNMLSVSLPLGVLVSSLMTFGNLGEHFELTAIKGSGISLLRALRPIFFFVVVLAVGAFYFNNYVVPAANLKAYSLLYDIKHTKPALDIKPGVFYNGIPDYSIKVKEKLPDNQTLKEVLIYDHTQKLGNKSLIIADSSRMYTFFNDRYLKLELFNGHAVAEEKKNADPIDYFYRTSFDQMEIVFDLSSFGLKDTDEKLFRNNRQMKNVAELTEDIDSLGRMYDKGLMRFRNSMRNSLRYSVADLFEEVDLSIYDRTLIIPEEAPMDSIPADSIQADTSRMMQASILSLAFIDWFWKQDTLKKFDRKELQEELRADDVEFDEATLRNEFDLSQENVDSIRNAALQSLPPHQRKNRTRTKVKPKVKSIAMIPIPELTNEILDREFKQTYKKQGVIDYALSQARSIKSQLGSVNSNLNGLWLNHNKFSVEKYKKYSMAFACVVMFLIGAPLGAIIKKGGLGVPVIVSIFFFIIYYVLTITTEKWAKAGVTDPFFSVWIADFTLLPIGLFFLRQARIDARLFETDFYNVVIDKFKTKFQKKRAQ